MKKVSWQLLLKLLGMIPPNIRLSLCGLIFSVTSQGGSEKTLKYLFTLRDRLDNCIDQMAIAYEGGEVHPKHRLTKYHHFFVQRLSPGDRVLDVGCGIGIVASTLAGTGAVVTGIDIDRDKVLHAQTKYGGGSLNFIHGDISQFRPEIDYDVIVLSNVLEHIEKRVELLSLLQTSHNPRCLLVRVPLLHRDWMVPLRKELGLFYYTDETHFTEYTVASFCQEVAQAGLTAVSLHTEWGEIWAELRGK